MINFCLYLTVSSAAEAYANLSVDDLRTAFFEAERRREALRIQIRDESSAFNSFAADELLNLLATTADVDAAMAGMHNIFDPVTTARKNLEKEYDEQVELTWELQKALRHKLHQELTQAEQDLIAALKVTKFEFNAQSMTFNSPKSASA